MSSNDWYCHNLCNNEKLETMNRKMFARTMPDYKTHTAFDPRPSVKDCGGIRYKHDRIQQEAAAPNLELNLHPCSSDADCMYPRILGTQPYNTRRDLEYLRRIDIDSYVRGITHYYLKDNECKCNNAACTLQNMEHTMYDVEFDPSKYMYYPSYS
jgi:hypothetical protein